MAQGVVFTRIMYDTRIRGTIVDGIGGVSFSCKVVVSYIEDDYL